MTPIYASSDASDALSHADRMVTFAGRRPSARRFHRRQLQHNSAVSHKSLRDFLEIPQTLAPPQPISLEDAGRSAGGAGAHGALWSFLTVNSGYHDNHFYLKVNDISEPVVRAARTCRTIRAVWLHATH